ncbi:MAG: 1-acyl-sn-glycerol-3-phosphate acyltransferase [Ichthyobacteriaceae bacterium]|nr:1-acyl-sn-glycerol-3-phosphate acyltransferase [Ichthyobacteriaceae bacterium]
MGFKNVEKYSIGYAILKIYLGRVFKIFYKTTSTDNSNTKKGDPVILAPNHQNALIDPLSVLFTRDTQVVFLGRSDIYKNKLFANALYFTKMLPVFRIRDGYENLGKNQAIFNKTMDIIPSNCELGVFPEANHATSRHIRQLKKGVSRMAFQTEMFYNEKLGTKIIPIGIQYEHLYWFRSRLHVNYGEPILVNDFIEEYKENNPRGLNKLNAEISKRMKELIANIPYKGETYEAVEQLCEINHNNIDADYKDTYEQKLINDKKLVDNIIELEEQNIDGFNSLIKKLNEYILLLSKNKTTDYSVNFKKNQKSLLFKYIILTIGFPFYIFGLLLNYLPYKLPRLASLKVKDKGFYSSVHYAIAAVITFPIFYITYFVNMVKSFGWLYAILGIMAIGLLGLFSHKYFRILQNTKKILALNKNNTSNLISLRKEIEDYI